MTDKHPEFPTFTEVGAVDVDAGMIWVGDPCYILDGERPAGLGKVWNDFCDLFFKRSGYGTDNDTGVASFGYHEEGTQDGLGVAISTFYGDGSYPVYVEYGEGGRPRRVLIDFDPAFDE